MIIITTCDVDNFWNTLLHPTLLNIMDEQGMTVRIVMALAVIAIHRRECTLHGQPARAQHTSRRHSLGGPARKNAHAIKLKMLILVVKCKEVPYRLK